MCYVSGYIPLLIRGKVPFSQKLGEPTFGSWSLMHQLLNYIYMFAHSSNSVVSGFYLAV